MGIEAITKNNQGVETAPSSTGSWADWAAATDLRNYSQADPLLDWLELYGSSAGFKEDTEVDTYDRRTNHPLFVMEQSRLFEHAVIQHLKASIGVTTITERADESRELARAMATAQAMIDGAEIIQGGVLWDAENLAYGLPDLLVRSDVLPGLFEEFPEDYPLTAPAPGIDAPEYHYVIVDIKFKRLKFSASGEQVANGIEELPDKAQVYVYNRALGRIQGYLPGRAFLLGRGWERTQRGTNYSSDDSFNQLGQVDTTDQRLSQLVDEGTLWIRELKANGNSWQVQPIPTNQNLYPNMNNDSDFPWHDAKSTLAHDLHELTSLLHVRVAGRNSALANGLNSWIDPGCSAAAVGITGAAQGPQLQEIIRVNQDTVGPAVTPATVNAARAEWQPQPSLEFYVDFETVNDLADDFSTFPMRGGQPMIFMIGCGHVENGNWQFECFIADRLTEKGEESIIDEWYSHMSSVKARLASNGPDPYVIHWFRAEPGFLEKDTNSAFNRHSGHHWAPVNWFDFLANVVEAEPVVVRGSLGFGLKPFAKALHSHGNIVTDWGDGLGDGLGAMVGAWRCDEEAEKAGNRLIDDELMGSIRDYNEVDCKVMMEIVRYLRAHH